MFRCCSGNESISPSPAVVNKIKFEHDTKVVVNGLRRWDNVLIRPYVTLDGNNQFTLKSLVLNSSSFSLMKICHNIKGISEIDVAHVHFCLFVFASGLVGTHWLFTTLYGHPPLTWGQPISVKVIGMIGFLVSCCKAQISL